MFRIQIPEPCHEDWNEMTPTQKGAFCNSCSKEVVDFTKMSDAEVQNYFLHKSAGKTCGRFRNDQIEHIRITLPENVLLQKMVGWKKYLTILLLAFGSMLFGCDVGTDNQLTGIIAVPEREMLTGDTVMIETVQPLMGEAIIDTSVNAIEDTSKCTVATELQSYEGEIMGDISIVPTTKGEPFVVIDSLPNFTPSEPPHKDTLIKKPASDTSNCPDTGYY